MTTRPLRLLLALLLYAPLSVSAIVLDCEINAERIYTCIEISDSTTRAETLEDKEAYGEEYSRYVEQARKSCVYQEPRRRTSGKNTGAALRSEQLKSARADYEQCISNKARELWRSNNAGATGE